MKQYMDTSPDTLATTTVQPCVKQYMDTPFATATPDQPCVKQYMAQPPIPNRGAPFLREPPCRSEGPKTVEAEITPGGFSEIPDLLPETGLSETDPGVTDACSEVRFLGSSGLGVLRGTGVLPPVLGPGVDLPPDFGRAGPPVQAAPLRKRAAHMATIEEYLT